MDFAKISTMGQDYALYSQKYGESSNIDFSKPGALLYPSITADFAVSGIKNGTVTTADSYTSAICAAAYLLEKRGLPLSEISFETANGNIEIFNTGVGEYLLKLNKCKLLYTKSTCIEGTAVDFCDVLCSALCRVAFVPPDAVVRPELARVLTVSSDRMPSAVVFAAAPNEVGEIPKIRSYSAHSAAPPSRAAICAATAYAAYISGLSKSGLVSFPSGARAVTGFSSVELHAAAHVVE